MTRRKVQVYGTINPTVIFIDDEATVGASLGVNLALGEAVMLINGQVLPKGYVLQASDLLNGLASTAQVSGPASDWSQISSKPTTFPPSAHNHAVGDITGFDAAARTAVVVDSIADADTTHAPSRNAVFDALATKANANAPSFTGLANAANDGAAATAGVPVGGVYRNGSVLMIRVV
jgi:hypothetical protein